MFSFGKLHNLLTFMVLFAAYGSVFQKSVFDVNDDNNVSDKNLCSSAKTEVQNRCFKCQENLWMSFVQH